MNDEIYAGEMELKMLHGRRLCESGGDGKEKICPCTGIVIPLSLIIPANALGTTLRA
jgi:hypothetical protein